MRMGRSRGEKGEWGGVFGVGVWFCDSRLVVIWRAAMTWERMEADKNGGGGVAAVRLLPPFSQTTAAAAGPFGGEFGRCRSIWRLQVYLAASFGRCRAVARPLHSPPF